MLNSFRRNLDSEYVSSIVLLDFLLTIDILELFSDISFVFILKELIPTITNISLPQLIIYIFLQVKIFFSIYPYRSITPGYN